MKRVTKVLVAFILCITPVFAAGCGPLVGAILSPTWREQKIPAEYDLKEQEDRRILVFVDSAAGSNVELGFGDQLAGTIEGHLMDRAKIDEEYLVAREGIEQLQRTREDFNFMTPAEVGKELDAGLVLYVLLEDYELYGMTEESYYSGSLYSRSVLFDSKSGMIVWPEEKRGHVVEALVEIDTNRDDTVSRLASATAQSISNKLFDCPRDQMKVGDLRDEGYQW